MDKSKLIQHLENQIGEAEHGNQIMVSAAASSPFNNSIDLPAAAQKHLKSCESRVAVQIYQTHRIQVLKAVLDDVKSMEE